MHTNSRSLKLLFVLAVTACACIAAPVSALAVGPIVNVTTSPSSIDFGQVSVDNPTSLESFMVTNSPLSNTDFNYTGFGQTGDSAFQVMDDQCLFAPLAPGDSCQVDVQLFPSVTGSISGSYTPQLSNANSVQTTTFAADIINPIAGLDWEEYSFGSVDVKAPTGASHDLTISNSGVGPLDVANLAFVYNDSDAYTVDYSGCGVSNAFTIAAGNSCTLSIGFKPPATGIFQGVLCFDSSDYAHTPMCANVEGNGVDEPLTGTENDPPVPTPSTPIPSISAAAIKPAALKKLTALEFNVSCGPASCNLSATTTLKLKIKSSKGSKLKTRTLTGIASPAAGGTTKLSIKLSAKKLKGVKSATASTVFTAPGASPVTVTTKLK